MLVFVEMISEFALPLISIMYSTFSQTKVLKNKIPRRVQIYYHFGNMQKKAFQLKLMATIKLGMKYFIFQRLPKFYHSVGYLYVMIGQKYLPHESAMVMLKYINSSKA